jgi:hypothetical protein
MASGVTAEAVWRAGYWQERIQTFQAEFEKQQLHRLLPTLSQHGYAGEDEIEAQLKLSGVCVQVFFPKYRVLVNVTLVDAPVPLPG